MRGTATIIWNIFGSFLLTPTDFELIDANAHLSVAQFALKFSGRKELVELFDCYQRAPKKYPTWHGSGLMYTRTALEQSSGEAAALFKASLLGGGLLIDLTGGLGIDTFAFSRRFKYVLHIERDNTLSDIARHNHAVMGADNVRHILGDATLLLPGLPSADAAFIDPSRRDGKSRLVRLQDCEPDLTTLAPALLQRIPTVLAKLSPLFDLHEIPRQLPHVSDIHVVSVAGEVKEILVRLSAGFTGEPTVHAVGLSTNGAQKFMVEGPLMRQEPGTGRATLQCLVCAPKGPGAGGVVLLPDAAVLKAGLSRQALSAAASSVDAHGLFGLAPQSPLQFPGRVLPLRWMAEWKPKDLAKRLKSEGIRGAQILTKGVEKREPEILKDLGLVHGDNAWIVVGAI